MKRKIYTIGYTGFGIDDFVQLLVGNDVRCLIDVREIPISRKPGFAKTALKNHLDLVGIRYEHFRSLGSPKALRDKLRADREYSQFFRGVRQHLKKEAGTDALQEVVEITRQVRTCLMCCCPQWDLCHRKCIVDLLSMHETTSFCHLVKPSSQKVFWGKAA